MVVMEFILALIIQNWGKYKDVEGTETESEELDRRFKDTII